MMKRKRKREKEEKEGSKRRQEGIQRVGNGRVFV